MHAELGIQHHDPANRVLLFEVLQFYSHTLEQAGAESSQLELGQLMFLLQLPFNVWLKHVRQLPVIPH